MKSISATVRYLCLLMVASLLSHCGGTKNDASDAAAAKIRPVSIDAMPANKQVYLKTSLDTIRNCDTNSDYKEIVKVHGQKGEAKNEDKYDSFMTNGNPITWITYLKTSSDSVYFVATVETPKKETLYAGFCMERKYIAGAFTSASADTTPKDARRGKGGHGKGRRGGGGGGMGGGMGGGAGF